MSGPPGTRECHFPSRQELVVRKTLHAVAVFPDSSCYEWALRGERLLSIGGKVVITNLGTYYFDVIQIEVISSQV